MTAAPPRWRSDLTVQPQATAEGTVVVVKDPVTGKFYRLQEAEYFIAAQCDGRTPAETIRQRTEQRFGASLPLDALESFCKTLERAHLLHDGSKPLQAKTRKRVDGGLLRLRFKVADPDVFFGRLLPHIGFFFTPGFLAASAITILLAVGTAVGGWTDIRDELTRFYTLSTLPLFVVVIFTVISLHEFGHGLTCKHFGGEVHEIGVMLMYFQPAFYCDVTDAWLLTKKSQRLWVSFAGPYFELFLWAVATLVWRATQPDTWIHLVALIVVTSSGIKTLFNFNPFIKLDGYYLLSDWLEIPNLRRQAFRHVGTFMERAIGIHKPAPKRSARDHWILLGYGLAALSGTIAIVAYVIFSAGGYLLDNKQPLAVLLALMYLVLKLQRRFMRLFGRSKSARSSGVFGGDDEGDDMGYERTHDALNEDTEPAVVRTRPPEPPRVVTIDRGPRVNVAPTSSPAASSPPPPPEPPRPVPPPPPPPPEASQARAAEKPADKPPAASRSSSSQKRHDEKRRKQIVWAALAAALVLELAFGHMELRVNGPFAVLPIHNADVRAEIDGIIQDIPVHEGQWVKQGDVIAHLQPRDMQAELLQTGAEMARAEARLKVLQAGATPDSIALARTAVARAQTEVKYATARLTRTQQLDRSALVAHADLEVAQEQFDASLHALHQAEGDLRVLLTGARPEEVDAARADVEGLRVRRSLLSQQLGLMVVRSPSTGVVATPQRQLEAMARQLVTKGALIAKVYDLKVVTAEITVPEKEMADVHVGEEVALKTRAYPDETFRGRVTSIATAALDPSSSAEIASPNLNGTGSSKTVLVTTEIDNRSLLLKPGMTGEAKIIAGDRRVSNLVARRLGRTIRVEFWSWW